MNAYHPEQPLDVNEDEVEPDEPDLSEAAMQAAWRSFSSWVEHDPWYVRAPLVAWFYLVVAWSYVSGAVRRLL